jgi:hypothetical protein
MAGDRSRRGLKHSARTATRRASARWTSIVLTALLLVLLALFALSIDRSVAVPRPTGALAVGKTRLSWTDTSRTEWMTSATDDRREVIPSLNPFPRMADRVITTTRTFTSAFFDRYLKNDDDSAFEDLKVPAKVRIYSYPAAG